MVMYFIEEDLASFGQYLLSDERREMIERASIGETQDVLQDRLKNVSNLDLANWAQSLNQSMEQ